MWALRNVRNVFTDTEKIYAQELAVALSSFERASEWPDLVKSLQKLNKVLNKYRSFHEEAPKGRERAVPSVVDITKRLAQCLGSGLPGGVHMKALATYETILSLIGPDNLVADISLYSVGLFPLLSYGSTRVQPKLLDIFETFYLPLDERLEPALNGFVLALMPGLEEPHSDLFPRAKRLMNELSQRTNFEQFVVAVWKCLLLCPQSRLAVMNYLSSTFEQDPSSARKFVPRDSSLCVEALMAGVHDSNVIVQRGTFDLIIKHYSLEESQFQFSENVQLLKGILPILLNREQSVNRRLYVWLLGSGKDDGTGRLSDTTFRMLNESLSATLDDEDDEVAFSRMDSDAQRSSHDLTSDQSEAKAASRPFRLFRSMTEQRSEIRASELLELLFPQLIEYLYRCSSELAPSAYKMVLKSAHEFFALVEKNRLWRCIRALIEEEFPRCGSEPLEEKCRGNNDSDQRGSGGARSWNPTDEELCARGDEQQRVLVLTDFALESLPIKLSDEVAEKHFPPVIGQLLRYIPRLVCSEALQCVLHFCMKMLSLLPKKASSVPFADNMHFLASCHVELPPPPSLVSQRRQTGLYDDDPDSGGGPVAEEPPVVDDLFLETVDLQFRLFRILMRVVISTSGDATAARASTDSVSSLRSRSKPSSESTRRRSSLQSRSTSSLDDTQQPALTTISVSEPQPPSDSQAAAHISTSIDNLMSPAASFVSRNSDDFLSTAHDTFDQHVSVTPPQDELSSELSPTQTHRPSNDGSEAPETEAPVSQSTSSSLGHPPLPPAPPSSASPREGDTREILRYVRRFMRMVAKFAVCWHPRLACIGSNTLIRLLKRFSFLDRSGCPQIAARLWSLLDIEFSDLHYEVADLFYELQSISQESCDRVIAEDILHSGEGSLRDPAHGYRRFATLWHHVGDLRPNELVFHKGLMLMLDALEDERPLVKLTTRTWLRESLPSLSTITNHLFLVLLHSSTRIDPQTHEYLTRFDAARVVYMLRKFRSMVLADSTPFLQNLCTALPSPGTTTLFMEHPPSELQAEYAAYSKSLLFIVILTGLHFIQGRPPKKCSREFKERVDSVRAVSVDLMKSLLSGFASLSERDVTNRANADEPAPKLHRASGVPTAAHAKGSEDSKLKKALSLNGRRIPNSEATLSVSSSAAAVAARSRSPDSVRGGDNDGGGGSHAKANARQNTRRTRGYRVSVLLSEPILNELSQALREDDWMMQVQLIGLLKSVIEENYRDPQAPVNPLYEAPIFASTLLTGIQRSSSAHIDAVIMSGRSFHRSGRSQNVSAGGGVIGGDDAAFDLADDEGGGGASPNRSSDATQSPEEKLDAAAVGQSQFEPVPSPPPFDESAASIPELLKEMCASLPEKRQRNTASGTLNHWVWLSVTCLPILRTSLPSVLFYILNVICQEISICENNRDLAILLEGLRVAFIQFAVPNSVSEDPASPSSLATSSDFNSPSDEISVVGAVFGYAFRDRIARLFGSPHTDKRSPHHREKFSTKKAADTAFSMLPVILAALVATWEFEPTATGALACSSSPVAPDRALIHHPSRRSHSGGRGRGRGRGDTKGWRFRIKRKTDADAAAGGKGEDGGGKTAVAAAKPQGFQTRVGLSASEFGRARSGTRSRAAQDVVSIPPSKSRTIYRTSAEVNSARTRDRTRTQILRCLEPLLPGLSTRFIQAVLRFWSKEMSPDYPRETDLSVYTLDNPLLVACPKHAIMLDIVAHLTNASPALLIETTVQFCSFSVASKRSKSLEFRSRDYAALHFLSSFVESCTDREQLALSWPHIQTLVRNTLQFSSSARVLLFVLGIVQIFVRRCLPHLEKVQKELQEDVASLIQACSGVIQKTSKFLASNTLDPLPPVLGALPTRANVDEHDYPPLPAWVVEAQTRRQEHSSGSADATSAASSSRWIVAYAVDSSADLFLIALRASATVLASLTLDVWCGGAAAAGTGGGGGAGHHHGGAEKGNSVLASFLTNVFPILGSHVVDSFPRMYAAVCIVSSLSVASCSFSVRSWKREVTELFSKKDFFLTDFECLEHWQWILARAVSEEKNSIMSLIKQNLPVPGTQLFVSKEQEIADRARQLKRLSFVVHSGRRDQFGIYIRAIVEKLVESLKIPDAEPLYTQVFLCLRVLLTRVSPDHLQTVWPIVLMEIIRTFEESMDSALLLSACKFIDLAVILLPRYFHLYQWCFVRGKGATHKQHRSSDKPDPIEVVISDELEVSSRDVVRKFGSAHIGELEDPNRSLSPVPALGLPQNQPHLQDGDTDIGDLPTPRGSGIFRQDSITPAAHDFEPHLVALSKRIQRTHGRFSVRSSGVAAASASTASASSKSRGGRSQSRRPSSAPAPAASPRSRSSSPNGHNNSNLKQQHPSKNGRLSAKNLESQKKRHPHGHSREVSLSNSRATTTDRDHDHVGLGSGLSPSGLRRPMLLMRTISADDFWVLSEFHDRVSRLVLKCSTSERSAADLEFVDRLLLSDFIDSDQFANPLCHK